MFECRFLNVKARAVLTVLALIVGESVGVGQDKLGDLIDAKTGIVDAPEGFADNDELWRSSWLYASLLTIQRLDPELYTQLKETESLDSSNCGVFLDYFQRECVKPDGWLRPGTLRNDMTMDQLVPFLYLMMVIDKSGDVALKNKAQKILESLGELEEGGKLIAPNGQAIGRNVAYMIDMLLDKKHYNKIYRTADMPLFRVAALGDERVAKVNRRYLYYDIYIGSLQAFGVGLNLATGVLDRNKFEINAVSKIDPKIKAKLEKLVKQVVNDYSAFNGIAAASFEAIRQGKDHKDLDKIRVCFEPMSQNGWGPAFQIVSDRNFADMQAIDDYRDAYVSRVGVQENGRILYADNDIIAAQRGWRISDKSHGPGLKTRDENSCRLLDYVILKSLYLTWHKN